MVFITINTRFDRSQKFSIVFSVDRTCTIGHIVALSGFSDRSYPIRSVMMDQFHFQCRLHLCHQSHSFPIWFWSKLTPNSISHEVQYCLRHILHLYDQSSHYSLLFSPQIALGLIDHNSLTLFSVQTAPIQSVMCLLCLVFITNCTWSNMSRHFSFNFGLDHTYRISYVVDLFGLHHISYLIQLVTVAQFHFRCRLHLYDQSYTCSIWFSSHSTLDPISHDSFILFSTQIVPIQTVTSLSYLVFVTYYNRSDRSRQFSIISGVERTCTISHVVVLSSFYYRSHPVKQVSIVQFQFRCRTIWYD